MLELNSGDIVYYSPNFALGLLISKHTTADGRQVWDYLLRSPTRSNLNYHYISKQQVDEHQLIANIENGRFKHYEIGKQSGDV